MPPVFTGRHVSDKTESGSESLDNRRLSPVIFFLCPGNFLNLPNESRALIGVSNVATGPDWQQSAKRLVDILTAGSRPMK
jgi:hypothetical protein